MNLPPEIFRLATQLEATGKAKEALEITAKCGREGHGVSTQPGGMVRSSEASGSTSGW